MAKRLVVCCDGTWNHADQKYPTNVLKVARAVAPSAPDGTPQVVFYDEGVGTGNLVDRLLGGIFGTGLDKNVKDAYTFLMNNYEEDDEVFVFGFSRGAHTARRTAGLLRKAGLLKKVNGGMYREAYAFYLRRDPRPDMPDVVEFRDKNSRAIDLKFLGVWDTVGAEGLPVRKLRWTTKLTGKNYRFQDNKLSRRVKHGYQALAIDEQRGPYLPTVWNNPESPGQVIEQVWFAGVHSDVGGGSGRVGLSDTALSWMIKKAEGCGLAFDRDHVGSTVKPDASVMPGSNRGFIWRLIRNVSRPMGAVSPRTEAVHISAQQKHAAGAPGYAPQNLVRYLASPDHKVAQ